MHYSGWELKFFDASKNFRNYQFKIIKNYLGKKVLEIGPGSGFFAKNFLLNVSDRLVLSEINSDLREKLKENFKDEAKVTILPDKIEDIDEEFDAICYFDVLEHIENDEIELINAMSKLKKNGHLIISVPAFNHVFSDYDKSVGHYRRYEKRFFYDFAKKNSLNLQKLKYFDSIGYMMLVLNKIINLKGENKVGLGTVIWNKLIPISNLIDLITLNLFGKSLICIIKK
jgi:SAM-dependent methyltransferase